MEPLRVLWCWPILPEHVPTETLEVRPFSGRQEGLAHALADVDAVLVRRGLRIDSDALAAGRRLRLVLRAGTNTSNIDLASAAEHGVRVATIRMHIDMSVAEHALALMLAVARRLPSADRDVREGAYRRLRLTPAPTSETVMATNWMGYVDLPTLFGRTLGIVGLGEIGSAVAERAAAFGMTVLYAQRRRADASVEARGGARYVPLSELCRESDFVSLHVPDTTETHHLVNSAFLQAMKPTAFLINVSRGGVVDEASLVQALTAGSIAGAALDVYSDEPLPSESPLASAPHTVLTPHIASGSDVGRDAARLVAHLVEFAQGAPAGSVVG